MKVKAAIITMALAGLLVPRADATGVSSDNVEYVTTVPTEAGLASGGRLVGAYFYVAGAKSFSIYDVSDPVAPSLVSLTPTGFQFPNEDVDTDGKILLLSNEQGRTLRIYDVEDKAAPAEIATLDGVRDHTFTCVLGCRWAYGSRGTIVDLRSPSEPRIAGYWAGGGSLPGSDGFDVTEVRPGIVLTSSRIMLLLDARRDPASPRVLARGGTPDNRLIHSNRWPRGGRERFFLVQGETPFSGRCNERSGALMTWDAAAWRRTRSFHLHDEFRVANGTFVDGNPPANVAGCTAMWFHEHPAYRNGGLVAAAFFEHGVRFVEVGRSGRISQVGYYTPAGGAPIAAYWITDEIVYSVDLERGLDVLRYTGEAIR